MTLQFLSQARAMRSALVNRLYSTDVCCEWVSCLHSPVDFLEFFPGNRNHHYFSDDVGCHEVQLVCHCEVGHCEVEDEAFELLILSLTLLMLWTYRYHRLLRFRQVSILHFQASYYIYFLISRFYRLISNISLA